MMDEIEELRLLVDECREWSKRLEEPGHRPGHAKCRVEFTRLAEKLDDIAKRLAARMPT